MRNLLNFLQHAPLRFQLLWGILILNCLYCAYLSLEELPKTFQSSQSFWYFDKTGKIVQKRNKGD